MSILPLLVGSLGVGLLCGIASRNGDYAKIIIWVLGGCSILLMVALEICLNKLGL